MIGSTMLTYWLRYRGTRFPIRRGEYVLGRSPYCSIVISNALASRQHCAVRLSPEGLVIQDLGSRNGTTVNGEPLRGKERQLSPGDIIRVGSDALEVFVTQGVQRTETDAGARRRHVTLTRSEACSSPPGGVPVASTPPDYDVDSNTYTHGSTIALVEAVAAAQPSPSTLESTVHAVQHAINTLIELKLGGNGGGIASDDAARIIKAVRTINGWFSDGRLDTWSRDVIAVLEDRP